ncbi:MAG TPA: hypothetical protein VMQ39_06175, partial [Candidatus Dormibacteraeota bacterium]|nr:hypothetical protein [Candidatus Dormibacteraeota bacterium]
RLREVVIFRQLRNEPQPTGLFGNLDLVSLLLLRVHAQFVRREMNADPQVVLIRSLGALTPVEALQSRSARL